MSIAFLSSRFSQELPHTIFRSEHDGLTIDVRENSRFRWLMFGNGIVQSAMSLSEPDTLVLPYTHSMLAPLLFNASLQRVLCLGIGGASLVRYLRSTFPNAHLTACDLRPEVIATASEYFDLPSPDQRLDIRCSDAREVVADSADQDLILVDVFGQDGMPSWVRSSGFFQACAGALSAEGILAINVMPDSDTQLAELLSGLRHVFLGRVLVTTVVDYRNIIVLALAAAPNERAVKTLGRLANERERRYGIPLARILRNICGVNVCRQGNLVI